MITLSNLSLQRGQKLLLEQTSLTIHRGWKVGITGANGSGKSSLFQLLLKTVTADSGDLLMPANLSIAHMAQQVSYSDRPAVEFVIDGDKELRTLQKAITEAETTDDQEALVRLHTKMDDKNGYNSHYQAEQLLHGLGFSKTDISKSANEFSGGWRIRLNLAQTLMCPEDLLLLDEPTNHLDLDATLWLEQWLARFDGTLLLISHDRDFLDATVQHLINIEAKKTILYTGNYSSYERQRAERLALQQAQYQKQQQRIKEIAGFVSRFRAKATKAKQAQSRLKELDRMQKIAPAHIDSPFYFRFPNAEKISDPLINLNDADIGYGKPLLSKINLSLHPGSRIALLGPNGAGKSTLIKALVGDLSLLKGERVCGEHLKIGYFAQHQLEALDLGASPALHLQRISPQAREQDIRNFLGGFNFYGDQALEIIKNFSGGEKARLALAIIAWQRPNLLLMDEPTNHLDLEMRHALTLALQEFDGAIILVSHDRHLLRNTADELLLVVDGRVNEFKGDLQEYQQWLLKSDNTVKQPESIDLNPEFQSIDKKTQRQLAAQRRQQLQPLTKKLQAIEKSMSSNQALADKLEQQLSSSNMYQAENKSQLQELLGQQGKLKQQLEKDEERWLSLTEELENLQNDL